MKGTREASIINIFSSAKFRNYKFKEDKQAVIALYNEDGYRDAKILSDSVWESSPNRLTVKLNISEGKQYSYQNIYDNISLLDDDLLKEINEIILKIGHELFKKKVCTYP